MRKLYALLAILFLSMAGISARANSVTPDVAAFTFTISSNSNVVFTNNSVLGNEPGNRRAFWSFGDGSGAVTGPLDGTQHPYNAMGSFTVCLRIYRYTSTDSVLSAQACLTLLIQSTCAANFETLVPASNVLGRYFNAIPTHSQNKKPVRICWNFGDNHDTCIQYATTATPPYAVFHQYQQPGNYNVCVNILYDGGCEATRCNTIVIPRSDSCSVNFEKLPVSTTANPLTATFKALPWNSQNKLPVNICWRFGDSTPDTCIQYANTYPGPWTINHTYPAAGVYEVCVKITYSGGCESYKCALTTIGRPDSCGANFERLLTPNSSPLLAYFKALPAHNNNKKPAQVCWNFGDGHDTCINYLNVYTGAYAVSHTYAHTGQYNVCVKITYYGGCVAEKCKPVQIGVPDSCTADFERIQQSTGTNPYIAAFRALWHSSSNRVPKTICWRFGDGRPDTCISYPENYTGQYVVSHLFLRDTTFEVCVKITYYGGCEAYKCKQVVIVGPPTPCGVHISEIVPSLTSLQRGFYAQPVTATNRPPLRVCWVFGDGTDSCVQVVNPTTVPLPELFIRHNFPGPGVYRTCVRVTYVGGCVAEDCKEVVIRSATDICGGYMTDSLTRPRSLRFRGFSIHNPNDEPISWAWSFGDGTTASGQEMNHTYAQGGTYTVCLLIHTRLGCDARICNTIHLPGNNEPALHLTPNPVINVLHASFLSTHNETVTIKIMNGIGTPVRTYTRNVVTGINNWDFDLSTLSPGIYTCVVQSPNQFASAIFIKQ